MSPRIATDASSPHTASDAPALDQLEVVAFAEAVGEARAALEIAERHIAPGISVIEARRALSDEEGEDDDDWDDEDEDDDDWDDDEDEDDDWDDEEDEDDDDWDDDEDEDDDDWDDDDEDEDDDDWGDDDEDGDDDWDDEEEE